MYKTIRHLRFNAKNITRLLPPTTTVCRLKAKLQYNYVVQIFFIGALQYMHFLYFLFIQLWTTLMKQTF